MTVDFWWLEEVPVSCCPAHRVEVLPEGGVSGHVIQGGVQGAEVQEVSGGEVGEDL